MKRATNRIHRVMWLFGVVALVGCAGGSAAVETDADQKDIPPDVISSDLTATDTTSDLGSLADLRVDAPPEQVGDTTAPTVEFVQPQDGASVEGVVAIEIDAQDNTDVVRVEIFVDGESLGTDEEVPYEFEWDATDLWSGSYLLRAVAADAAGNVSEAEINVTVLGECDEDGDCPPTVDIDTPEAGAYVGGLVEVKASAGDDDAVVKVRFLVDGGLLIEDEQVPYKAEWDTAEFDDGPHLLAATAYDTTDKTAAAQFEVTVDNTPPEIALLSPEEGAIQHDEILLSAEASDTLQMDLVKFTVDDGDPEAVSEEPWEVVFDGSALAAGTHVVEATAFDAAGNEATVTREFLVDRPPVVVILAPEEGAMVPGGIVVQAEAGDDIGLAGVALYVDGAWAADLIPVAGLHEAAWTPPYEKSEHLLSVVATDSVGQESEAAVTVMVDHPVTVALLFCDEGDCEPLVEGMEMTGVLALKADAQDDGGEIIGVDFLVDDALQHQDTEAPFDYLWGTTTLEDGVHTVKAVAWNSLEQKGETEVIVQVNNCDLDHDEYLSAACGGPDCDDGDPGVNPGVSDLVGNATDENCDGVDGVDADGDGWASELSGGADCGDDAPLVHPCGDDLPGDDIDGNCDGADALSCDDCVACIEDAFDGQACIHTPVEDGGACDDGDLCTGPGTCQDLVCLSGEAVGCNDDNYCTDDFCEAFVGCQTTPNTNPCDDQSVCTYNDTCAGGECVGTPISCDDVNQCTIDTCDPMDGCQHSPALTPECMPEIVVTFPTRGVTLDGVVAVDVTGTVTSLAGLITSFTVNGDQVPVAPDGSFSYTNSSSQGMNLLIFDAEDLPGGTSHSTRAYFWSNTWYQMDSPDPKLSMVDDGIMIFLGPEVWDDNDTSDVDDLATIMTYYLGGLDLGTMISNPMLGSFLFCDFWVYLMNITYGSLSVDVIPSDGGLHMYVSMPNFEADIKGFASWCPDFVGTATASSITITTEVLISVDGEGNVIAEMQDVDVNVNDLDISLSEGFGSILDWLIIFFEDDFAAELEASFEAEKGAFIEDTLADALGSLALDESVEMSPFLGDDAPVTLQITKGISSLTFTPEGGVIGLRAKVTAPKAISHAPLGSIGRDGCGSGAFPALVLPMQGQIEMGLHDDLFNQLLFAMYWGGLFAMDVDAAALGVELSQYGLDDVDLNLDFLLAPILTECTPDGGLVIQIGDMQVDGIMDLYGIPVELTIYASVEVEAELVVMDSDEDKMLSIVLGDIREMEVEITEISGALTGAEDVLIALIEEQVIWSLLDNLAMDALESFPLPDIDFSGMLPSLSPGTGISIGIKDLLRVEGYTLLTGDVKFGDCGVCPEGMVCVDGICCLPDCMFKECGDDGCGGACGECAEILVCSSLGVCEAPVACGDEVCTGQSVDAYLCALEMCYGPLLHSANFSSPSNSDISSAWNAVNHFGNPNNDLTPWAGVSYGLLATGPATGTSHSSDIGGFGIGDPYANDGYTTYNNVEFKVVMTAPANAVGFSIDYIFLSEEYEEYIGTSFNDKFYIFLKAPLTTGNQTIVTNYTNCSNPNAYYDFQENGQKWCYIATNTAFSEPCSNPTTNISGTGFECGPPDSAHGSSTGWLTTQWPIQGGETFDITFHIHDSSDAIYDSEVILDNFHWLSEPFDPGTTSHD